VRILDPRLLAHARAARVHLASGVLLGMATAGLAIAQAGLLASAISGAVERRLGLVALAATLGWLAAVLVARSLVSWARESTAQRASAEVKSTLRLGVLRRAVELGSRRTTGGSEGELVALATRGIDALDGYFTRYLPQLVLAVVLPVAVVATILPADLVAGLTVGLTVPLIVVFMVLIGLATDAHRRRRWRAFTRLAHHFADTVSGLPTLKVFGRAQGQSAGLARVTDDYRRESLAALRIAFLSAFALELGATLSVALVAVGIGLRLVAGELDLQTGLFVLILAPEAYLPIRQLGTHFHASEQGLAAADAAFTVIEAPRPPRGERTDVPDLRSGSLMVDRVSVRQPGRGVAAPFEASLQVRPGEVVAVAGPSGAGKTTLLMAIAGLVAPDEGEVRVAGAGGVAADVRTLAPDAWRRQIAWVAQEPYLFPGSVADNVRLAEPTAPNTRVSAALAGVGLPELDPATPLGERGAGLSVGQRRRVAIARAFVRDAPLMLLDEPTAGLDEETERSVLEAIRDVARRERRAVILVAHRAAALAVADRVVHLAAREMEAAA
jgi:ATP-binding cassette subfamily C protein CydCD